MSANTDVLRKLLKKQNEWIWTDEHTKAFNKLKEGITKIPCLAHYNAQNENKISTDASTKGLGQRYGKNKKMEIKNQSDSQADIYTQRRKMR